jgi:hypothetical protein
VSRLKALRLMEYNGGRLPEGVVAPEAESNVHLA